MRKLSTAFICFGLLMLAYYGTIRDPNGPSRTEDSTDIKTSTPDTNQLIPPNQTEPAVPLQMPPPADAIVQRSLVPDQLAIPAIGLKAPVVKVGKLPSGAMDVPNSFDRVGLLYPAVIPGQNGNAVMDGHVDHYTGPAVFFYLKRLKPGDKVIVSEQGESLTFIVKSVEAFTTAEAPLDRIFGAVDSPRLNLITCTGKFDKKTKEHEKRLVVFTEIERP